LASPGYLYAPARLAQVGSPPGLGVGGWATVRPDNFARGHKPTAMVALLHARAAAMVALLHARVAAMVAP